MEWRKAIAHGATVGEPFKAIFSPGRGDRKSTAKNSFAPSGAGLFGDVNTHGFTVGYYLPRLRRWRMDGRTRAGSTRSVR